MERKHAEEGIGDISNCVRCHRNGEEGDSDGLQQAQGGDDVFSVLMTASMMGALLVIPMRRSRPKSR
jgi:hypothetical protein